MNIFCVITKNKFRNINEGQARGFYGSDNIPESRDF